jgi:hypothetical protein
MPSPYSGRAQVWTVTVGMVGLVWSGVPLHALEGPAAAAAHREAADMRGWKASVRPGKTGGITARQGHADSAVTAVGRSRAGPCCGTRDHPLKPDLKAICMRAAAPTPEASQDSILLALPLVPRILAGQGRK